MIDDVVAWRTSEDECRAQARNTSLPEERAGLFCDAIWDGLMCWPCTPAGTLITALCPEPDHLQQTYLVAVAPSSGEEVEVASKLCGENGTWFVHEEYGNPWTNYSLCSALFPVEDLTTDTPTVITDLRDEHELYKRWFPVVKTVSQLGYGVSLVTLVAAICVLAFNRRLRCTRNFLHLHLFTSFLLRAFMALLKDHLFVEGVSLTADFTATWDCKMFTTVWNYSMMANYSWILMEGLYLHNLIFQPLSADNADISIYVALGWGLPILFLAPWVVVRTQFEDKLCWTTHDNKNFYLIIKAPVVVSILLSFALFLNIVRVLLLKLRTFKHGRVARRHFRYSRWARSTLVLVPLFGVHYALLLGMSYYIGVNQTVEIVWLFCDQLFGSFQGCCVSLLYCLLNIEVRAEVGRKWRSWRLRRQPRAGSLSLTAVGQTSFYGRQMSSNDHVNNMQLSVHTSVPTMESGHCDGNSLQTTQNRHL